MNKTRPALKRKITAIMAADVAEFTRIIAEDEEEGLARLESYRQVFDDFVKRSGGRVFNSGGDSVMCEFPSAVEATRCAIDIQESLRTRNLAQPPNRQMHFRIGISIGDVVERDGDLLGDGVNVAARLQSLAEPGSICVARNVQEAVSNKVSVHFRDLGHREVKNLPHPVHAFQIEMGGARPKAAAPAAPVPARADAAAGGGRAPLLLALAAGIIAMAAGAGLYWTRFDLTAPQQTAPTGQPLAPQVAITPPPQALPAQQAAPAPQVAPPDLAPKPGESIVVTEDLTPAQAFAKLAQSGGLVRDARTAAELYHNARTFEARGETANARRDYLAFAALGTDHIDPLLRLAALIRTQDGRAGAREVFAELARGRSRAAGLVHALQFDGSERQARLAAFADANPDFGPAHALLAFELGEDRQNTQTIAERRHELAALDRFAAAEGDGRLVPHFLDQSMLAQWLDRAQRRGAEARTFFAEGRDRVSAQFTRNNAGWSGAIALPEAATALDYRLGPDDPFRSTGFLQALDPRTGKPMPNPAIELPPQQGLTRIALRYRDARGVQSEPAIIVFDPATALARGLRDMLERTASSWLAFGTGQNGQRLYYAHLVSYRCAIEKVEIGFNGAMPDQVIALPACDRDNPYRIPAGLRAFIDVRPGTDSAAIRLTFAGGDTSAILTFPRPR
jgi:class 3 adenylate cyclase